MIHKYNHMNRFMYLSKRTISNDIKSLYPKCINCINFKIEERSCKKFVTSQNYIDNDGPNYELALHVRNDNTKCGEEGKLFDIGKEELEKDNKFLFNASRLFILSTGILSFLTNEAIIIVPFATIGVMSSISFIYHSSIYKERIENEKKRIEDYAKFYRTINKT